MKKSKVTTEDLAGMVQRGFDDMREEFNKTKDWQRLTDGRLDAIEMELIDIKKKLENVIYRHELEFLKERVQKIEKYLTLNKKK